MDQFQKGGEDYIDVIVDQTYITELWWEEEMSGQMRMEPSSTINRLSVVILAGGNSSRMGFHNKACLEIQGQTFMEVLSKELGSLGQLVISARQDAQYSNTMGTVAVDIYKGCGPVGGLHAALQVCQYPWVFVVACDMPFVRRKFVDFLASFALPEVDAVIPRDATGIHPLCGLYRKEIWKVLDRNLSQGNLRMRDVLDQIRVRYVAAQDAPDSEKFLNNINTPQDYQELFGLER